MAVAVRAGALLGALALAAAACAEQGGPGGEPSPLAPQKRALLIAINDYATINDLDYCARDVLALRDRLVAAGFPPENIVLLYDAAQAPELRPLKDNIGRALQTLLRSSGPDDTLLVVFSGHGVHLGGASYLCPVEARPEDPAGTMIPLDYVYRELTAAQARLRLLLVDACRNDPRQGRTAQAPQAAADVTGFARSLGKPPAGVLVLTSCAPGQVSVEDANFRHGVFMYFILQGLEGNADREDRGNLDGRISLLELFEYASRKTKTHVARTRNILQTPTLYGAVAEDHEIALALPQRSEKLPSRFYTGADPLKTLAKDPDVLQAENPQALLALQKACAMVGGSNPYSRPELSKSQCDEALAAASDALRLEPQNPFGYLLRAMAHRARGDFPEALADLQKLGLPLRLEVTSYASDGVELRIDGQVTGKVNMISDVIVTRIDGSLYYVDAVAARFGPSQPDPTAHGWIHRRHLRRHLEVLSGPPHLAVFSVLQRDTLGHAVPETDGENPQLFEALRRAQDILTRNGAKSPLYDDISAAECDRAIAACDEALRLAPGNEIALVLRGIAHREKRDFAKALADFQQVDMPLPLQVKASDGAKLKRGTEVLATLRQGDELNVTRIQGDWLWVEWLDRDEGGKETQGYVHASRVE